MTDDEVADRIRADWLCDRDGTAADYKLLPANLIGELRGDLHKLLLLTAYQQGLLVAAAMSLVQHNSNYGHALWEEAVQVRDEQQELMYKLFAGSNSV